MDSTREDGPAQERPPRPQGDRPGGGRPGGRSGGGGGGAAGVLRPPEQGRTRKHAGRYAGWGDGVDRVWCAARVHHPAPGFPAQARAAATRPIVVVDRREGEVLLCDGEHWGDHRWPHLPIDECPE